MHPICVTLVFLLGKGRKNPGAEGSLHQLKILIILTKLNEEKRPHFVAIKKELQLRLYKSHTELMDERISLVLGL